MSENLAILLKFYNYLLCCYISGLSTERLLALVESLRYDLDQASWIVEAVLMYLVFFIVGLSPMSAAVGSEIILTEENAILYFWHNIDSTHRIPVPSFWVIYTLTYLALSAVFLLITILRVRRQEQK